MAGKPIDPEARIDIDQHLHKCRNRIDQVGVELEGGWDKLPSGTQLEHDGSVRITLPGNLSAAGEATYLRLHQIGQSRPFTDGESRQYRALMAQRQSRVPAFVGEWPLRPQAPGPTLDALVRECYPPHVNETCGMHVHISFRTNFTYQRLMTMAYPATVLEYVRRWAERRLDASHCIWPRLRGESRFCQHIYNAEPQAKNAKKGHDQRAPDHRYTVIHYCWSRYRTVECRLLPMMPSADLAVEAINEFLAITNAFLKSTDARPTKHVMEVLASSAGTRIELDTTV